MENFDKKLRQKVYFGHNVEMKADIGLDARDIEAWMEHCVEPEVLDWLAKRAKRLAYELRNDDYDDFRSRA